MKTAVVKMSQEEIKAGLDARHEQCIVVAASDGHICWDITDTREREPIHEVKSGDRFWCWNFKETPKGYTHDFANMAPTDVLIQTDVALELVYITDDSEDPQLFITELDKSPNWT
ncbi:hypothetical protein A1QO_02665 [Vibrio genomosp. F10 str. ZF-129]|uniref:Uncharacterized protein n=1 Tax=Vibrio genomosp. F10 str. ZF-129 TaxID=1187848 RepID=A0A1E5BLH9_9VIBR|nr:hypothetical protein [Vibrio genomosp. F10]OEE38300.1 hypothetical protein A1QO_02665 [Vibrio genomosp. F10 str. ZF-129]